MSSWWFFCLESVSAFTGTGRAIQVNFPVTWDLKGSMVGRSSGTQSPTQKESPKTAVDPNPQKKPCDQKKPTSKKMKWKVTKKNTFFLRLVCGRFKIWSCFGERKHRSLDFCWGEGCEHQATLSFLTWHHQSILETTTWLSSWIV